MREYLSFDSLLKKMGLRVNWGKLMRETNTPKQNTQLIQSKKLKHSDVKLFIIIIIFKDGALQTNM